MQDISDDPKVSEGMDRFLRAACGRLGWEVKGFDFSLGWCLNPKATQTFFI